MMTALSLVVAALAAGVITSAVHRYTVRRGVLDFPNGRSLHRAPTPRGGGLAIALVVVAGTVAGWLAGVLEGPLVAAILGGGIAVAIVGWIDDERGVSRRERVIVHLTAAAWAVAMLGGLESLDYGVGTHELGPGGSVLAVLGIAWLVNLYNFMDGIDGLAGGEAAVVGLAGGLLAVTAGARDLALIAFLTAGASIGFLAWNWSPARIFLGDVGSSFLGFVFGVVALASERTGAIPLLAWAILLGVFVFDATVTLGRRALRGERWYAAHRTHAYQRAVRSGWSHARVTSSVLALNIVLAGLGAVAVLRPALLPACGAAALVVLSGLYLVVERRQPPPPVREVEAAKAHP